MKPFRKNVDPEEFEDEDLEESPRILRPKKKEHFDSKSRKKKAPPKPWGRRERFFVGGTLVVMVAAAFVLAMSARSWKFPGLPRIKAPSISFPFFGGETIILEGSPADQADRVNQEKVKAEFNRRTQNLSGVYGLYVVDLNSGFSYGVNEKEVFQAASLIKLPIMASVYLEAEKGEIKLSEYRRYLEAMGKKSDNNAQIKVVNDLGEDTINAYIKELGMRDTSLEKNETTPYDIGEFFEDLWNDEILDESDKEEFLEFLTDTIFEDWLVAGIPDGVRVAHKYGRETHVVNDAGIVFADEPYVVVIMSKGVVEREADEIIPKLAQVVHEGEVGLTD